MTAVAAVLFLTRRAVEKQINAIFMKLNLRDTEDTSRRVTATLIYLAGGESSPDQPEAWSPTARPAPASWASRR